MLLNYFLRADRTVYLRNMTWYKWTPRCVLLNLISNIIGGFLEFTIMYCTCSSCCTHIVHHEWWGLPRRKSHPGSPCGAPSSWNPWIPKAHAAAGVATTFSEAWWMEMVPLHIYVYIIIYVLYEYVCIYIYMYIQHTSYIQYTILCVCIYIYISIYIF